MGCTPTEAAWIEGLLAAHERPLVAYATRLLGGDLEAARDVVQDAFLRLCRADPAQVRGHEVRWLYAVCRNRVIDRHRKERRMTTVETEHLVDAARAVPERTMPPETARVLALVDRLPPRQQEAVRLRFHGGLSYAQIAEVMETSVNNVGVLLHAALRALRERLETVPATATVAEQGGTR